MPSNGNDVEHIPLRKFLLLRIAVSLCFAGHGILALMNSNIFYSQWSQWVQSIFPHDLRYMGSQLVLGIVGSLDLLVAIRFLLPKIPGYALLWAIVWGTITAISRLYFLGSWQSIPTFINFANPIGEFLVRVPNFFVPIVVFIFFTEQGQRLFSNRFTMDKFISIAVFATMAGLFFEYLAHLFHPLLQLEIDKIGMPLWYFHLSGALIVLAVCAMVLSSAKSAPRFNLIAAVCCGVSYALIEGFTLVIVHSPHGMFFLSIQIAEHMPTYICLLFYIRSRTSHHWKESRHHFKSIHENTAIVASD